MSKFRFLMWSCLIFCIGAYYENKMISIMRWTKIDLAPYRQQSLHETVKIV
jgi:hypothetical protein